MESGNLHCLGKPSVILRTLIIPLPLLTRPPLLIGDLTSKQLPTRNPKILISHTFLL